MNQRIFIQAHKSITRYWEKEGMSKAEAEKIADRALREPLESNTKDLIARIQSDMDQRRKEEQTPKFVVNSRGRRVQVS